MTTTAATVPATPIAIIGIGCRFPGGVTSPRAFWELLHQGRVVTGDMPADRPGAAAFGNNPIHRGGYLANVDRFDPGFFGITADEARAMDPQQRLVLEAAWEAMEDAAVTPDALAGSDAAVYVGLSTLNYGSIYAFHPKGVDRHALTGTGGGVAANRVSYHLDLRGPSFSVDGACASSLLAVHLACRSIWSGESSVAFAGGANVVLIASTAGGMRDNGMVAPDGRCRVFDAAANGWVRGEGAAVVLLKPLDRALADGDPVYAVIRGTAAGQNGRGNGLGGPNRWAQEAVLRAAYARGSVDPARVHYVEAHSTGTLVGDATELAALGAVVGAGRAADAPPCAVGSLKGNVGHMEAAAGVGGLVKVALMLRHRRLLATPHYEKPNPHAPLAKLGLTIQAANEPWTGAAGDAIAGISASGYGGANVHVVLAEAPAVAADDATGATPHLLALSAKSPQALRDLAGWYADWLGGDRSDGATLADLCRTANTGRVRLPHRLATIATDAAELRDRLRRVAAGEPADGVLLGEVKGRSAAAAAPAFDASRDRAAALHELAQAFVTRSTVDLRPACTAGRRVHGVPTYPFQRASYWMDAFPTIAPAAVTPAPAPAAPAACAAAAEPTVTPTTADARRDRPATLDAAVAPADDRERKLVRVFEQVLNVAPVGALDSFFDLGGSSAAALQLFATIEREFGLALPLSTLYADPTVRGIAAALAPGAGAAKAAYKWETLIEINAGGPRAPLFFVPGLGGHAFDLRMIAQGLGDDQPVCVLHPQGLDPSQVPLTRVEEIAAAFLLHVRERQPHGPYRLGGYSFGGSVAYEMACQLAAAGERVDVLGLIDAFAPEAVAKRSVPKRVLTHVRVLWKAGRGNRLAYIGQRLGRLHKRLRTIALGGAAGADKKKAAALTSSTLAKAVNRVADANLVAWRAFRPRPYGGRVTLFRAGQWDDVNEMFTTADPANGWRHHARHVDVVTIACQHLQLFKGENLTTMTDRLRAVLAAADAAGAPAPTDVATGGGGALNVDLPCPGVGHPARPPRGHLVTTR